MARRRQHGAKAVHRTRRGVLAAVALGLGLGVLGAGGVSRALAQEPDGAGAGGAEHPTSSLTYERQRGAERCPDEAELRDAVSARLGYEPFRDDAPQHVRTVIRAERGGLLATVDVFDAAGEQVGQREIRSRTRDCEELARGVALAISVAIDPVSLLGPGPVAAVDPVPVPVPVPDPVPVPVPDPGTGGESEPEPEPEPEPEAQSEAESESETDAGAGDRRVVVALDVLVGWEVVPKVRPGFGLRVNIDRGWLGSELALRGWVPAEVGAESGDGRVSAYQLDVRALGCVVGSGFRGCVGGFAGLMPARGSGVPNAQRGLGVVAGVAASVGYDLGLGERVLLGARVGLDVPLLQPSLRLSNAEVWQGAPVSVFLAIGVGVRLR